MKDKKSLIIYFSRADENYSVGYIDKGNTEVAAEYIKEITGADMFKVEPLKSYSADYNSAIEQAKQRQINHDAPIVSQVPDISEYEVIYIGSPIYWGTMPEELFTALNSVDFNGKIIRPFTTHEGSGLGNVVNDLKRICIGALIDSGLAIQGSSVYNSKDKINNWVNNK